MVVLLWILRVIVGLIVVRAVLRMFTSPVPVARRSTPVQPRERLGGALVRDPQCGTYIPQSKAIALTRGDSTAFFCSTDCRDAWAAAHRS